MTEAGCRHGDTEPARQARWRLCRDCGQLVHRVETDHYASLADARQGIRR